MNFPPKVVMWLPLIWAGLLAIFAGISDQSLLAPAYLAFLPMGFVWCTQALLTLHKRVDVLEAELKRVHNDRAVGGA